MGALAIVVMEPGSDWPTFVAGAYDVVALGQPPGEPHDAVLRRARERLTRAGSLVQVAAVACNAEAGEEAMRRRARTATTLLRAFARAEGGRLILSAGKGASSLLRRGLLGLATALNEALEGSAARVTVRVGDRLVMTTGQALPWVRTAVAVAR